MGEKGEGSGGKEGGNWKWGTPCPTPQLIWEVGQGLNGNCVVVKLLRTNMAKKKKKKKTLQRLALSRSCVVSVVGTTTLNRYFRFN